MRIVELALWICGVGAGGLVFGVLVYTLASFGLSLPHTERRPLTTACREVGRELALAMLTQPFLPLFYLFGHRMPPRLVTADATEGVPVVFVHGYFHNRIGFLALSLALARRGIGPFYGFNYPWFVTIESNAERLRRFVERVRQETGSVAVDLVCHSMGGLVAMEMLRASGGQGGVRRLVTIATPHAGVAWRGPIPGLGAGSLRRGSKLLETHASFAPEVPVLSVFSTHDNVVHPKETSHLAKRGGRDVEVEGRGHLSILFSPVVAEHVAGFLLEPAPPRAESEEVGSPPRDAAESMPQTA